MTKSTDLYISRDKIDKQGTSCEIKGLIRVFCREYLNDGLVNIASHGMNSTGEIKFDLPDLEAVETVETITTADNVALPDNYLRDVSGVFSITNGGWVTDPSRRPYNFNKFKRWYPVEETGPQVVDVVVRNKRLFYTPTPVSPETLQLLFIEKPTPITFNTSPDAVPEHLQELTLCSYAAWRVFKLIEDGIEGVQVNTDRQMTDYMAGLAALRDQFGVPDMSPING